MTTKSPKPVSSSASVNPKGRLDILAFRIFREHVLPEVEKKTGIAGLAGQLEPIAESFIGDLIPPIDVLERLKPKRRLC